MAKERLLVAFFDTFENIEGKKINGKCILLLFSN